ncbi:unnamed protein product [Sphagnum troendelagicum]|uniref:Uncharacterized protein n=1 Tax=Sphagnum troendelagicum TaxID=128251 RepID=A0ABP0TEA4_9BRYO
MQWTPPSTIVCNESSFCVTKPICLFCCFSCCFFFQLKGGGTVGNALTAASGLGLNARIFTKVISLSSYFITLQRRRVWRRGVKERIQRYLDFKNKRTREPLWLKD